MAPNSSLEKQYMSSSSTTTASSKPAKVVAEPRPSASIILLSPVNHPLLLHRVRTSSSFASAHVFPGGNLDAQDGIVPANGDARRHEDSKAYRVAAVRECFEESGILLARKSGEEGLIEVEEGERERVRKDIHAGKLKFQEWVESIGGILDIENLHPFTRWITPIGLPKRFTTQMYIYFLPLTPTNNSITMRSVIPTPTSDGGLEHTAALFASASTFLSQAAKNEIILFPPQFYLLYLLTPYLTTPTSSTATIGELQQQREEILQFLKTDGGDGSGVVWKDKVMSPTGLYFRTSDGRSVLGLDKPGPELKDSGRGGDRDRVVLVKFGKDGPRNVEVRLRKEVLDEERDVKL